LNAINKNQKSFESEKLIYNGLNDNYDQSLLDVYSRFTVKIVSCREKRELVWQNPKILYTWQGILSVRSSETGFLRRDSLQQQVRKTMLTHWMTLNQVFSLP
jgi:hypothetical protein